MHKAVESLRNGLAILGLLAVGYTLGSSTRVKAANSSADDVSFQLTGVTETSSLLVYHPEAKALYVYRGATIGSSQVQCSYKFQIGPPGAPLQRTNCPIGSAQ